MAAEGARAGADGRGDARRWLDQWETIYRGATAKSTAVKDLQVVGQNVRPQLAGVKLAALTSNRINVWLADLKAGGRSDYQRAKA